MSFLPPIRTIRWMPVVMQGACQIHSLAVKCGFLRDGIKFQRKKYSIMAKNATCAKFSHFIPSRLREGLGEGMSKLGAAPEQALPRPLPQAGGEQRRCPWRVSDPTSKNDDPGRQAERRGGKKG